MSKNRDDSYIFCAALIRASERSFLPESELTRAAEAADFAGAMSVLTENGYGSLKAPEKPRDFAKLLAEEERRNYDFVFSALPDQEELVLFRYPKDYHNAKAVLKAEFLGTDPEKYLTEGGSFSPEAMVSMIRERNFVFMSSEMKEAVNRAAEVFGKGRDPQEIDIILDKACYSRMLNAAEKTENLFLINYVRLLIDILNVITFVRLRQMKKPWTFFSKVFLPGGQMAESLFVGGYEENYHKLAGEVQALRIRGNHRERRRKGQGDRHVLLAREALRQQENRIYKRRKIHFFRHRAGGGVPNRKRQRDKESQNDFYGKDRRNA